MSNLPQNSMDDDPLFAPISNEKAIEIEKAVKNKMKTLSFDEIVDTDSTKISGQNYALISLVSPQSNQKCDQLCLKIKGVFSQLKEAQKCAKRLQRIDTIFDIYVVEMYAWLLIPPDNTLIDQVHVDEKLNELISGHREGQLKAQAHFEERKRELIIKNEEELIIKNEEESVTKTEEESVTKTEEESVTKTEEESVTKTEEESVTNNEKLESITESSEGIVAESSVNISEENSTSTAGQLMHAMVINKLKESPSTSWADEMEEVN